MPSRRADPSAQKVASGVTRSCELSCSAALTSLRSHWHQLKTRFECVVTPIMKPFLSIYMCCRAEFHTELPLDAAD
jgi:hypothetical protein